MNNINTRTSKVLVNGEFVDIEPIDIKKNMIFKMFESDGEEVKGLNGNVFKATCDAFYNDDGVITIEMY